MYTHMIGVSKTPLLDLLDLLWKAIYLNLKGKWILVHQRLSRLSSFQGKGSLRLGIEHPEYRAFYRGP